MATTSSSGLPSSSGTSCSGTTRTCSAVTLTTALNISVRPRDTSPTAAAASSCSRAICGRESKIVVLTDPSSRARLPGRLARPQPLALYLRGQALHHPRHVHNHGNAAVAEDGRAGDALRVAKRGVNRLDHDL